jgi:hypothetical protein
MAIWNILQTFVIFYEHLVGTFYLVHFSGFGITNREKSGNPGRDEASVYFHHGKLARWTA